MEQEGGEVCLPPDRSDLEHKKIRTRSRTVVAIRRLRSFSVRTKKGEIE